VLSAGQSMWVISTEGGLHASIVGLPSRETAP
jgi:hypothetical protein